MCTYYIKTWSIYLWRSVLSTEALVWKRDNDLSTVMSAERCCRSRNCEASVLNWLMDDYSDQTCAECKDKRETFCGLMHLFQTVQQHYQEEIWQTRIQKKNLDTHYHTPHQYYCSFSNSLTPLYLLSLKQQQLVIEKKTLVFSAKTSYWIGKEITRKAVSLYL